MMLFSSAVPRHYAAAYGSPAFAGTTTVSQSGASALDIRHQPFAERDQRCIVLPKRTIDEVPGLPLRHRKLERRDQPAGGEIILDIGPQPNRHADAVDRRLQRHGIVVEAR